MRWFTIALADVVGSAALNAAVVSATLAGPAVIQGAGGFFSIPVMRLKEKRWTNVVRQQYDFSCVSAAWEIQLTYPYEMTNDKTGRAPVRERGGQDVENS